MTVYRPEVAAGALAAGVGAETAAGAAVLAPGIVRTWPIRIRARALRPLAAMTAETVVL